MMVIPAVEGVEMMGEGAHSVKAALIDPGDRGQVKEQMSGPARGKALQFTVQVIAVIPGQRSGQGDKHRGSVAPEKGIRGHNFGHHDHQPRPGAQRPLPPHLASPNGSADPGMRAGVAVVAEEGVTGQPLATFAPHAAIDRK